VLSPSYLDERSCLEMRVASVATRSSHNTFMTLLVEQGIVGALVYVAYLGWLLSFYRTQTADCTGRADFWMAAWPAVLAAQVAILVGTYSWTI